METLQFCRIHINLVIILVQLYLLVFPSSGYTIPDKYFINCGSDSPASLESGRSFIGDASYIVGTSSKAVKGHNQSTTTSLYQTARVFQGHSSSFYQFHIDQQGIYIIRLHFFAFSTSDANLISALFSVRASEFLLLSNFSVSSSNSPVVKEFLLTIDAGKLIIDFIPYNKSYLAFVNAMEVFLAPESFIPDNTTHVSPAGTRGSYSGLLHQGFHTVHRINFGGEKITEANDSLWRSWIPDDGFLSYKEDAKNCFYFEGALASGPQESEYSAPEHVYRTCKQLKSSKFSNITWGFNVSKNSKHLVRVHFCDFISGALAALKFKLNIYSNFSNNISSYDATSLLAAPFYFDFIVDSDNSGIMSISVHKISDSVTQDAYLNGLEILEMLEQPNKPTRNNRMPFVVGLIGSVLFLVVLAVALLVILKYRRAKAYKTSGTPFSVPLYGGSSHNWLAERAANISLAPDLKLALKIQYAEIQRATKNFNTKLLIGEGGFGKVYKGTLREGVNVAVKRSEPGHGQGLSEFQTEIIVLSQIRHRHLVSLIGYCDERNEMILVYEFMEKGTLREHLYTSEENSENYSSRFELSWEQRLKICIDAAKGLHYLHTGLSGRIIHRDVKSTNILLNEDYIAKVADFGLSKSGPIDPDENTGVKGSFGYLDPEYFMSAQLTEKSDVYSFGVVLLEVLCARPVIMSSGRREKVNLAEWGMLWLRKGQLEKIIDPALSGTINSSSLRKFGETAEKCLKESSAERPVMHDVMWDLEFALRLQQNSMETRLDDESMNSANLELGLQAVNHLPSHRVAGYEDDTFLGAADASVTMATGVFSQLRMDGGR